jgi:hypothetical protein
MAAGHKTSRHPQAKARAPADVTPTRILAVDVGGSKVKILAMGQTEARKAPSGKSMTPVQMVKVVKELASDWEYDALSIGVPALVGEHGPRSEPGNLGSGWVGFNFAAAFELPVRIVNDAAMQALGSYEGGRMLFLGLGTGLGSTLIAENVIVPLELGLLRYKNDQTLGEVLGRRGMERQGRAAWRGLVQDVVAMLAGAFVVEYVVLGGGNAKSLKELPPGVRLGHNLTAFRGGFRLWSVEDVPTLAVDGAQTQAPRPPTDWRVI